MHAHVALLKAYKQLLRSNGRVWQAQPLADILLAILLFADYIALFSYSASVLQRLLQSFVLQGD